MADYFVTVPIETDSQTLKARAVAALKAKWAGWTDNDADQEVMQFEAVAPMAADCAVAASRMFPAAFRAFGEKLSGVPYEAGSPATTTASFNLTDTDGPYEIPEGFELDVDGYAFAVETTVVVPNGVDTVSGVVITATGIGSERNDLMGTTVTPIGALSYIEDVVLDSPTDGGADAETDRAYENRLVIEQRLRAKTLVTPPNFEADALFEPGVGRAIAIKDNARNLTVVLTDIDGEPVSQAIKDRLEARWEVYKQVNTNFDMPDATYTTVNVAGNVVAYPGFNTADLKARIQQTLASWLLPGVWGAPKNFGVGDSGVASWYNETVVRLNKLIDLIGDVEGVNYVSNLTINGAAADLNLPGIVALTRPGNFDGINVT